jgi:hypothetical protein
MKPAWACLPIFAFVSIAQNAAIRFQWHCRVVTETFGNAHVALLGNLQSVPLEILPNLIRPTHKASGRSSAAPTC